MYKITTPLGDLDATFTASGLLTRLVFSPPLEPTLGQAEPGPPMLGLLKKEMDAYFAGRLRIFSIPMALKVSPFQLEVIRLLADVLYGETTTYGELARALGSVGLARAVGRANGANPIHVLIPCHRVIGADGGLTGYAGGLEKKAALLRLEQGKGIGGGR
jgi:methylated-DNA-[protein]-cysteine S-methyltransferase